MTRYLIPLLLPILALGAHAAPATQPVDPSAVEIQLLQQQRDQATQAAQNLEIQISVLQSQLKADEAKIAALTAAPKPPPAAAKPATHKP